MTAVKRYYADRELSDRERKNFAILNAIRKKGPIARTDISRLTGFNIVTVSNYIDHYIKQGLVLEEGYDTSTGGRKPMLVDLKQKESYFIGVGFDMMGIIGVMTDLKGEIVFQVRRKYLVQTGIPLIKELMNIAEEIFVKSEVEKDRVKGMGFALSGIIDNENRTIKWGGGPLGSKDVIVSISLWDEFSNRFNMPILIENDADCAVFGEQWLALNPDYKNVLYMYSGVSCGIMINGQIYGGTHGFAGELGVSNQNELDKYDWKKESYGLGRWDMELGTVTDLKELQKKYSNSKIFKLVNNKIEEATFITILEAASQKDECAVKLVTEAGERLGKKIAFLVNLLNPQAIIIGGGVEKAGPLLMDTLKKAVKQWALEESTRTLKIIPAQLAENAVPLGAACLVIKHYFEQM